MIPKIIHYCWFGKKQKPRLLKKCIKSWKRLMPDYKVIEWNESNTDLSHPFVKKAYEQQKWAFVSDYIRLKQVYDYGGVYFDTDIVAIKNISPLLKNNFFIGLEDKDLINASIFGSIKNHLLLKKCIDYYDKIKFDIKNVNSITIPKIVTKVLRDFYDLTDPIDKTTYIDDIVIYDEKYFYPFPFSKFKNMELFRSYIENKTYTVHLWYGSWIKFDEFLYIRRQNYFKAIPFILKGYKKGNDSLYKYFFRIAREVKYSLKNRIKI